VKIFEIRPGKSKRNVAAISRQIPKALHIKIFGISEMGRVAAATIANIT
jgi:hypothetical protein